MTRPDTRYTLAELIVNRKSMLGEHTLLPNEYSLIESRQAVEMYAYPKTPRQVRIYIIWDNPLDNLSLTAVLDKMRETGAAMVQKVEPITE